RGSRYWAQLPARMVSSTWGEILQPQPAPWLYWVRRMGSVMAVRPREESPDSSKPAGSGPLADAPTGEIPPYLVEHRGIVDGGRHLEPLPIRQLAENCAE